MAEDLKNNQEIQEKGKWGGARQNSGRPKGSGHKPKLSDDLTEEEKMTLIAKAYDKAVKGDSKLLQFFIEQIYGKAQQNVGLTDGEGNPFKLVIQRHGDEDNKIT